jgi:hypothetical protein
MLNILSTYLINLLLFFNRVRFKLYFMTQDFYHIKDTRVDILTYLMHTLLLRTSLLYNHKFKFKIFSYFEPYSSLVDNKYYMVDNISII